MKIFKILYSFHDISLAIFVNILETTTLIVANYDHQNASYIYTSILYLPHPSTFPYICTTKQAPFFGGKAYMKPFLLLLLIFLSGTLFAQTDSTKQLQEVVVRGFETSKSKVATPAAIEKIGLEEITRYQNVSSPLPILNAQAGVRMEERSPGSYRLSIRGSSLRSPFGVRNVKVYWNGIPLSDANGTTYLNLIDFANLENIELLKGPSSSMYGAGYGGVIHLETPVQKLSKNGYAALQAGSYGTLGFSTGYGFSKKKLSFRFGYSQASSEGYREHSAMKRFTGFIHGTYQISNRQTLNLYYLGSGINYETPGGLTLTQTEADRKASRPAAGTTPSSKEQDARIKQNYNSVGFNHNFQLSTNLKLNTTVYFIHSTLYNPFITNYEARKEKTCGYRIVATKKYDELVLHLGSEGIFTRSAFDVYDNNGGTMGNKRYNTLLQSNQLTHFFQAEYNLPWKFNFSTGLSYNTQLYNNTFSPVSSAPTNHTNRPATPWSPRIALLKSFGKSISVYYTLSNGYSAPTAQETMANYETQNIVNLKAEKAISHEIGFKTRWNTVFSSELSVYSQNIKNALVRSVSENGNEFFQNTGLVHQKGLEFSNDAVFRSASGFTVNLSLNFTYNDYTFGSYLNNSLELKGKNLPGTSKTNVYLVTRLATKKGIYLNIDLNQLSNAPLNNENTLYAPSVLLSTARIGWRFKYKKVPVANLNFGIENLFNAKYSAGYDFNAFGGRFHNPAPARNFNAGLRLDF